MRIGLPVMIYSLRHKSQTASGIMWDSLGTKILYVNGIEVAKDMVRSGMLLLEAGGVNTGFQASILHRPGYWSGLIDEARIDDIAITSE